MITLTFIQLAGYGLLLLPLLLVLYVSDDGGDFGIGLFFLSVLYAYTGFAFAAVFGVLPPWPWF